jgi:hypothetical protein
MPEPISQTLVVRLPADLRLVSIHVLPNSCWSVTVATERMKDATGRDLSYSRYYGTGQSINFERAVEEAVLLLRHREETIVPASPVGMTLDLDIGDIQL